jgi:uroporphyrinogen decarboxylase
MLAALQVRQPDRVPVWIHAINELAIVRVGRLLKEGVPEPKAVNLMTQEEMSSLLDTLLFIHEALEIDGFTSLPMSEVAGVTNLDDVRYRDAWGTTWARSPHGLAYMVEPPLSRPEDLRHYRRPTAGPGEALTVRLAGARFAGQKALFFLVRGAFVRCWRLRGMEALLMDLILHPAFVHELAEVVTEYNLELCRQAIDAGADVLIVEDDVAGKENTLISPRHFQEFVAPYNQRVVDEAHAHGLQVVCHSDGNLWSILDILVQMGYDGLNPLEPQAGMDLKRVKDYCGQQICLLGNIDCGELLCHGSEEEVESAVIQAIEDAAPGGGYVLCSSNSIHPGVKPESFLAMVRAAKKYGVYGASRTPERPAGTQEPRWSDCPARAAQRSSVRWRRP